MPVAGRFFHDIAVISGSCGHGVGFTVDAYADPEVGRRLVRWPPPETVTPTAPAKHRVAAPDGEVLEGSFGDPADRVRLEPCTYQ